ncbi:MAG: murein L,D-transpeptidase catalytic domain family protein [Candidatus Riflebacteria bacterium]|nr:murein L,D-transpeptidase catalytic domain family protein [Candidatus Riflebacteria bacterium]
MQNSTWLSSRISTFICRILIASVIGFLFISTAIPSHAETDETLLSLPDDPTQEKLHDGPPLTPERAALLAQFQEPNLTPQQIAEILSQYKFVDPQHVIPQALLNRALVYFDVNKNLISNQHCLSVVNFSEESRKVRFHIINMTTGEVVSIRVAHGIGSDPKNTGYAVQFGNTPESHMSSLGIYLTAETYKGENGDIRCRLDGLSKTNSNVRDRNIVIHGADYVEDANIKPGRSWGCLATSRENHERVVNELKEGSIIFAGTTK